MQALLWYQEDVLSAGGLWDGFMSVQTFLIQYLYFIVFLDFT